MSSTQNTKKWNGRRWIRDEKRLAVYLRDGLSCAYCGATTEDGAQFSLDHIKPRSKGGKNETSNLVTCCTRCNSRRQNRPLATWIKKVAGYCGVDEKIISRHVRNCRARDIDVKTAKGIMARRGGLVQALSAGN